MKKTMLSLMVAAALATVGCDALLTTAKNDDGNSGSNGIGQIPGTGSTSAKFSGRVLDLAGKPAANVQVKGYLVSNNAAGIISNNASGYRTLAGDSFQTKTDSKGNFVLSNPQGLDLNIEAILQDDIKAITMGVSSSSSKVDLKLAYTGRIVGTVKTETPGKNMLGVDVFIPGTGYVAKADDAGNYEIPNVPPGEFRVVGMHSDMGRGEAPRVSVTSKQVIRAPEIVLGFKVPQVTALSPDNGGVDQLITITGKDFSVSLGKKPQVLFNGIQGQVIEESDTALKVKVPELSTTTAQVLVKSAGFDSNTKTFKVIKTLDIFPQPQENAAKDATASAPLKDYLVYNLTRRYVVRALDAAGAIIPNASVTWSSVAPWLATVDANGRLQGLALGTVTVKASSGQVEAMLPVELLRLLTGLSVTPNPLPTLAAYPVGEQPLDPTRTSVQLQAKTLVSGGAVENYPVTWSTGDARLTVSPDGLVTLKPGAAEGNATVTVRSVANPSLTQGITIPVVHQGSLELVIE
ncbi:Ig-like domain-containing protein [bacterium]|nr:Ig-like domain-containing protein [bacterium]